MISHQIKISKLKNKAYKNPKNKNLFKTLFLFMKVYRNKTNIFNGFLIETFKIKKK